MDDGYYPRHYWGEKGIFFLLKGWCVQNDHGKGQAWRIQGIASRKFIMAEVSGECHGVLKSEDEALVFKEETKRDYMQ